MEINPFDYKDICYDDYLNALYEEDKTETIVKIRKIENYKKESNLPEIKNDTTCKTFVISAKKKEDNIGEKTIEKEPEKHIYATSKPGVSTYHTIKKGETLESIAKVYNVTVLSIMKLNNIKNKRNIKIGQTIKVL